MCSPTIPRRTIAKSVTSGSASERMIRDDPAPRDRFAARDPNCGNRDVGIGVMSQDKAPSEPSMEEILSSIRRIIADEQGHESPTAPAMPAIAKPVAPEDDVLELTDLADDEP